MVSNSVSAPATASATNTNSDNDTIMNTASNAGGRKRRKKRKAPTIDHLPNKYVNSQTIHPTKVFKPDKSIEVMAKADKSIEAR